MSKLVDLQGIRIQSKEDNILVEIKQLRKELGMTAYDMLYILVIKNQKFKCETEYFMFGSSEYWKFLNDISRMYYDLKGETNLKSYDYPGFLKVSVNERGYFEFEGEVTQYYSINSINSENKFYFKFALNQTYFESIARRYKGINGDNWKEYFDLDESDI
jgi:hypothetical protein